MKNNNRSVLFAKIAGVVCMLAFFSCFMGNVAQAAENGAGAQEVVVVSSRTADDGIYIYIKGVSDIASGTTVQVGNTLCEDVQVADIASTGMAVRTTILFDNSLSLSQKWGSQAKELVAGLIDHHAEGEEFRLATFADGLNVLSDFSTDYESLKATAEGIEFLNQDSYLTDILYDLIKPGAGSNEANYTRFVIITDGADDNDIKYTQAELSDLMKGSDVVIHTVGVKASNNNSLLENLFSYARLTGGTYAVAEADTDVESIRSTIDEDYSLLCLRIVPKAEVMDGSRKEAKLNLNTSNGSVMLTASIQMPFADVSSLPSESEEPAPAATPAPTPTPAPEKSSLPSISVEPPKTEKAEPEAGKNNIILIVGIGGAAAAVILILVVLLVLKGRKKKQVNVVIANNEQTEGGKRDDGQQAESGQQGRGGNTDRLGAHAGAGTAGKTRRLQGGTGQNVARQSFIVLTDISNPRRSFRAPIDTRIVIGRESGDIVLGHDAAVSYTHCEIIKKGNLYYINDLKSSNGTVYGNAKVYCETPIMSGGILEIGECKYKITIEN